MHPLESSLAARWPPSVWHDQTVMVALSGGADSVALVRALQRLRPPGGGRLLAAHFHHGTRAAADGDRRFVEELCQTLGIELLSGRRAADGAASEERLRLARYEFLRQAAEQAGARYLATAHTADDQVETILHRLLRGTGLAGLAGMRFARPLGPAVTLVRPLLESSRAQVRDFLTELGQPWRDDDSNDDLSLTRNRIRRELLPLLAERYQPNVGQSLLRLGKLSAEASAVIEPLAEALVERAVRWDHGTAHIDCGQLAGQPEYLVREAFQLVWRRQGWPLGEMGFGEWQRLAEMVRVPGPRAATTMLPGAVRARRADRLLELSRR